MCHVKFTHEASLSRHKSWTHQPGFAAKLHSCDICKKSYRFKNDLSKHVLNVHLGATYQCEICKNVYRSEKSLIQHISISHGDKKYSCDKCSYISNDEKYLRGGEATKDASMKVVKYISAKYVKEVIHLNFPYWNILRMFTRDVNISVIYVTKFSQ